MINDLDCRGMNCPEPVLRVRNIIVKESPPVLSVLVDNEAACQNVCRFFEHQNFQVITEKTGSEFRIVGTRADFINPPKAPTPVTIVKEPLVGIKKVMVVVTSDCMGHGDDGLGDMLMFNFLKTLKEMRPELWRLVFVNKGVSFTAEGSEAVPVLQELAAEGVQIFACGACLAYFHILDKIQVGEITNMLDIITGMKLADSVITI
jgi:selenium metabolism protein YedF